MLCVYFGVLIFACLAQSEQNPHSSQSSNNNRSTIIIRADVDCDFSVDGKKVGFILRDHLTRLSVDLGEHILVGINKHGKRWEHIVTVQKSSQKIVLAECIGVEPEVIKQYRQRAVSGDPIAQVLLGSHYFLGELVEKDIDEAIYWNRKSAEQNIIGALINLGDIYEKGVSGVPDYKESMKWYKLAATHKYVEDYRATALNLDMQKIAHDFAVAGANYNVGRYYYEGLGVEQNHTEAYKWIHEAAILNLPVAQATLGSMYENGLGVGKSEGEALIWYRKAALKGNRQANDAVLRIEGNKTNPN